MLKNKPLKIVVSGSLAYDKIMDFPGRFADHILPGQIHNLNLSFTLSGLRQSFGGTAGNIAYNLSLLQEKPIILGVLGFDFYDYQAWLQKKKIDLSAVKIDRHNLTAAAQIITDQDDNQIASFYPGPRPNNYALTAVRKIAQNQPINLAIIAPDDKERMLSYAAFYNRSKIIYIFDPGQALPAFKTPELRKAIKGAAILIGNDYEIKLIGERLKADVSGLLKLVSVLIITKGSRGSEIYRVRGKKIEKIKIKSARPANTSDPTGAGDAYRAGLIKGLIKGYDLKTCGQIAALTAVYTVEKYGTQTHKFTLSEFKKRYQKNFGEILRIS